MTEKCNYHEFIDSYMNDIRDKVIPSSKEIKLAMDYVESKLNDPDVFIDSPAIEKGVGAHGKVF